MSTTRVERLLEDRSADCADPENRLETLRTSVPSGAAIESDLVRLRTLADGTRYRLARILNGAEGEVCVCELTPLFDVSESAVSHALADLVSAGLAERRKDGKWRFYRATERSKRLFATLDTARSDPDSVPATAESAGEVDAQ